MPLMSIVIGAPPGSVRLLYKDKRGAGDDRRAGADKADVDVLDLTRAGAAGGLQRALDDVPQAVDAAGAEAAAEGVERQVAVQFDAPVLDEVERLAFLAEPVAFEPVDHRGREAVVDLRDIDVLGGEAGALPGQLRRAGAAFHVAGEAADAAGDLEVQPLAIAGEVGRGRLEVAGALGGGQHDGDRALYRNVAIEQAERVSDHARGEIILAAQGRAVEIGVRVVLGVLALGDGQGRHLVAGLAVFFEPAGVGDRHPLPRPAKAVRRGELRRAGGVASRQVLVGATRVVHRAPDDGVFTDTSEQRVDRLLHRAADIHRPRLDRKSTRL